MKSTSAQVTFKIFILWILVSVYFLMLVLSGPAIFLIRSRTVSRLTQTQAADSAAELSLRTESLLSGVE